MKHIRQILLLFTLLICEIGFTQSKHALVITISKYPIDTITGEKFRNLNSHNDRELVGNMLAEQGFNEENIIYLANKKATHQGVEDGFEKLIDQVSEGDIVYIHYSGHGQQLMDIGDKDEADGYDECLAVYDSPPAWYEGYDGSRHFRDDEINTFLQKLRKKLGKNGQVIVVLDSCHSGSGTRGGSEEVAARGKEEPCAPEDYKPDLVALATSVTDNDIDFSVSEKLANLTSFSGCRADQINYEYEVNNKNYGSLTYFFTTAVKELDSTATHRNLFAKIKEGITYSPYKEGPQDPVLESDNKDELVFKGMVLKQEPYFDLVNISGSTINITGGSIHGLSIGDTIGFYDNTVLNRLDYSPIFTGTIISIDALSSAVKVLGNIKKTNEERLKYRAFLVGAAILPLKLNVKIEITNKKLNKSVKKHLAQLEHFDVEEDNYEYIIQEGGNDSVKILVAKNGVMNCSVSFGGDRDVALSKLEENLNKLLRLKAFMKINVNDPSIKLELVNTPEGLRRSGDVDSMNITNKGTDLLYIYYFYVGPDMKGSIIPIKEQNGRVINYVALKPENSHPFRITHNCSKANPCGMNELKLIVSSSVINGIENLQELNTENYGTRGDDQTNFFNYFNNTIIGVRGEEPSVETISFSFEVQE